MSLINKCEEYAFFKTHRIVFKSFEKTKSSSLNKSTLMFTSFDTSKAKFVKITTIAIITSSEIKVKFVKITSIAKSTLFATSTSNESTLMLASSVDYSKSIFDNSLSFTSTTTSKKSIF